MTAFAGRFRIRKCEGAAPRINTRPIPWWQYGRLLMLGSLPAVAGCPFGFGSDQDPNTSRTHCAYSEAPQITTEAVGVTVFEGQTAVFRVGARNAEGYRWFERGPLGLGERTMLQNGIFNSLAIGPVTMADDGRIFTVTAYN